MKKWRLKRKPVTSPEDRRARAKAHRHALADTRPFIGVDGEGGYLPGTDRTCNPPQDYVLLQAGERALHTGLPLTTEECLEFIVSLPRGPIYVGFSFGYDVSMILHQLPGVSPGKRPDGTIIPSRRDRLLHMEIAPDGTRRAVPMAYVKGEGRYVYWGAYGIEYLPRNYLRVCRVETVKGSGGRKIVIPDTSITIYETFGFFQKAFLAAVDDFKVGTAAQHTMIRANKALRGEFTYVPGEGLSQDVRDYCALECDLLAQMMEAFRRLCLQAGLRPRTWNGAGKLSKSLLDDRGVITAARLGELAPPAVLTMASDGYYGGRFETPRIGRITGDMACAAPGTNYAPAFEYDLRSAYPAAMPRLPCLEHGRWVEVSPAWLRKASPDALWIAPLQFRHHPPPEGRGNLCGLPIRRKDGRLFWPAEGRGVYWSVEVAAARKLHCEVVRFGKGWAYEKTCDCKPFDWVAAVYEQRMKLGKDLRGYPLKLVLNAIYGLLAQRIGNPKFRNLIWAGLITAMTRAAIIDAAALDPEAIAMIATDGILSIRPLPGLAVSEALGAWEQKEHASIFIVQPGLYWGVPPDDGGKRKLKTRGAGPKFFENRTEEFERVWHDYYELARARERGRAELVEPPVVKLPIELFVGIKIAQSRGKPETACRWVKFNPDGSLATRNISFAWHEKRGKATWDVSDCAWTYPLPGAPDLISRPHDPHGPVMEGLDFARAELTDEQPDLVDYSPPWVD